jgi:hypothetical protein
MRAAIDDTRFGRYDDALTVLRLLDDGVRMSEPRLDGALDVGVDGDGIASCEDALSESARGRPPGGGRAELVLRVCPVLAGVFFSCFLPFQSTQ